MGDGGLTEGWISCPGFTLGLAPPWPRKYQQIRRNIKLTKEDNYLKRIIVNYRSQTLSFLMWLLSPSWAVD